MTKFSYLGRSSSNRIWLQNSTMLGIKGGFGNNVLQAHKIVCQNKFLRNKYYLLNGFVEIIFWFHIGKNVSRSSRLSTLRFLELIMKKIIKKIQQFESIRCVENIYVTQTTVSYWELYERLMKQQEERNFRSMMFMDQTDSVYGWNNIDLWR